MNNHFKVYININLFLVLLKITMEKLYALCIIKRDILYRTADYKIIYNLQSVVFKR